MRVAVCAFLVVITACPGPDAPSDPGPTQDPSGTLSDGGGVVHVDAGMRTDAAVVEDIEDAGVSEPNAGWIGGRCASSSDCTFMGARCLTDAEGFPGGTCTQDCTRFCPDQEGLNSVTFCVAPPTGITATDGLCVSRCDYGLYPGTGCREGYGCREEPRNNESSTVRYVCLPGEPQPQSTCLEELVQLGVPFEPTTHADEHPDGRPDLTCSITDPVRITGAMHGVSFAPSNILVTCALALALERATAVLAESGVTRVEHYGTYNCRFIAGTSTLSQHAYANAIDLAAFNFSDGTRWTVNDDFEIGTMPTTEAGQWEWDLVNRWHDERVFNIILTPNYNDAHRNHFHVDMTSGSHFLRSVMHDGIRFTDEDDQGDPSVLAPSLHGD